MNDLLPVPEPVVRTAAAALATRAERAGGGTARAVVIATALSTGYVRPSEIAELADWHARNPDAIQGDASTLIGGLYGGAAARDAWPPAPEPAPATAAVKSPMRTRLRAVSKAVNAADSQLRVKLQGAVQLAYEEALRQAGVKLQTRARSKAARAALDAAAGRPNATVLAAVGVTEQELLDKRFDTLATTTAGWVAATERRKVRAAAKALGLDPDEIERGYEDDIDQRATAAGAYLAGAVGLLARSALSGHSPAETLGEQAGPVPYRLVRNAWTIGATGHSIPHVDETGPGPAQLDSLSDKLSRLGPTLVEQLLGDQGVQVQVRSTWTTGGPDRPFEPHQELEGLSWVDTQPDELNADPAEFPYVEVYEPGDHDGCACEIIEEYEDYTPADGEGDGGESADSGVLVGV